VRHREPSSLNEVESAGRQWNAVQRTFADGFAGLGGEVGSATIVLSPRTGSCRWIDDIHVQLIGNGHIADQLQRPAMAKTIHARRGPDLGGGADSSRNDEKALRFTPEDSTVGTFDDSRTWRADVQAEVFGAADRTARKGVTVRLLRRMPQNWAAGNGSAGADGVGTAGTASRHDRREQMRACCRFPCPAVPGEAERHAAQTLFRYGRNRRERVYAPALQCG